MFFKLRQDAASKITNTQARSQLAPKNFLLHETCFDPYATYLNSFVLLLLVFDQLSTLELFLQEQLQIFPEKSSLLLKYHWQLMEHIDPLQNF